MQSLMAVLAASLLLYAMLANTFGLAGDGATASIGLSCLCAGVLWRTRAEFVAWDRGGPAGQLDLEANDSGVEHAMPISIAGEQDPRRLLTPAVN